MKTGLGSLSSLAVWCLVAIATGCGGDDDGDDGGGAADAASEPDARPRADAMSGPDATPADLSCAGDPLPAVADDPVTVGGTVFTIEGFAEAPVEDAIVEARRLSDDMVLEDNAPGGTPADGTYSLTAATGGEPLEAYLYATKAAGEFVPTRLYPPAPVTANLEMVPIPLMTELLLNLLAADQEPDNGIALVIVADCAGDPVQGATVTADPAPGQIVYAADNGFPDEDATSTGAQGLAYLINVPVGAVTVDATASGESLLEHEIESVAGEVTATVVLPGPVN